MDIVKATESFVHPEESLVIPILSAGYMQTAM